MSRVFGPPDPRYSPGPGLHYEFWHDGRTAVVTWNGRFVRYADSSKGTL